MCVVSKCVWEQLLFLLLLWEQTAGWSRGAMARGWRQEAVLRAGTEARDARLQPLD